FQILIDGTAAGLILTTTLLSHRYVLYRIFMYLGQSMIEFPCLDVACINQWLCATSIDCSWAPDCYNTVTSSCLMFKFQDQEVTSGLKKIPGVPLLYIILNIIVLDKPSLCSVNHVQAVAQRDCHPSPRKRKISNPNPLSCLKKKKQPQTQLLKTEGKRKKSRIYKVSFWVLYKKENASLPAQS
uniref:UTP23 sensor motif region domain-containing protein n=1 Tax=Oncorhynchus mykiss TaxID=8022 RepID=A0A8K9URV4_ONCMY